jgi:hypothetical protein
VSYHRAHSVQVGAEAAITGQGNVFETSLLVSIFIQVQAVYVGTQAILSSTYFFVAG